MQLNNPYAQYKEQSLSTLAPGEVLVKLFDELLKQCRLSVIGVERGDLAAANEAFMKAQTIVSTLASSLDMRYPISQSLRDMYIFWAQQLMQANLRKDTEIVQDLLPLMKDLRDSFDEAEKINRMKQVQVSAAGGRAAV